jgi:hypothetical protein
MYFMIADATSEQRTKALRLNALYLVTVHKIIIILFCKPNEMRFFKLIFAYNIRKAELQK